MKPSPFAYHRAESVQHAVDLLAEHGSQAKVLAGGQSLLPILSMRLAAPAVLVDINRLSDLAYVRSDASGVRVGALARHRQVERDAGAATSQPLLRLALQHVAHPTIRNRGTSVGSLVHADPSGELTAVLALTGGSVRVVSAGGERVVPAVQFFLGPLESAVGAGELAVDALFPASGPGSGHAFVEVARRHGDYAVCGVAAAVQTDPSGAVTAARTAYISCSPVPVTVDLTAAPPTGDPAVAASWSDAAELALTHLEPEADIHASADYRAHLARTLTARALAQAAARSSADPSSADPQVPAA